MKIQRTHRLGCLLGCSLLMMAFVPAFAEELETYQWIAVERPQQWSNPDNWDGPMPPPLNPTDRAVFSENPVEFNITLDDAGLYLGELVIDGGRVIFGGGSITKFDKITIQSGRLATFVSPGHQGFGYEIGTLAVLGGGNFSIGFTGEWIMPNLTVLDRTVVGGDVGIGVSDFSYDLGLLEMDGGSLILGSGETSGVLAVRGISGVGEIGFASVESAGSRSVSIRITTPADESFTFGGTIADVIGSAATVDGSAVSLVKEGPGTQILSGTNTFSGIIEVREGTLILEKGATLSGEVRMDGGQFVDRNKS